MNLKQRAQRLVKSKRLAPDSYCVFVPRGNDLFTPYFVIVGDNYVVQRSAPMYTTHVITTGNGLDPYVTLRAINQIGFSLSGVSTSGENAMISLTGRHLGTTQGYTTTMKGLEGDYYVLYFSAFKMGKHMDYVSFADVGTNIMYIQVTQVPKEYIEVEIKPKPRGKKRKFYDQNISLKRRKTSWF